MLKIINKYFRLITESKYVLLINLTDKIYSFFIFFLLAKNFSYIDYGEVVTVFTLTAILSTIISLGLPIFIQREIARNKDESSKIFSNALIAYIGLLIPYLVIAYVTYLIFYNTIDATLFMTISAAMYISSICILLNSILSGKLDFKHQFIPFLVSRSFILIFFVAGLYYLNFDLLSLLLCILTGFVLHLILLVWFVNGKEIYLRIKSFDPRYLKLILKTTMPLAASIIINYLYDKADVVLISKLLDFSKVALYNVGYGIFKTSTIAFSFILVSGFTRVSFLSRNKRAVYLFLRKYSFIVGIISIILCIFLYIFSNVIIHLFYSSKYDESIIIVKILSFGIIALGLNNLTGIILNGMGFFKTVMFITLFALIANIILNILFIPLKGIMASAIITVLTEYFIFFIEYYYLKKALISKNIK